MKRLSFYNKPVNKKVLRIAKFKFKTAVNRAIKRNRLERAWYAPPRKVYSRVLRKFVDTKGGPGYRLGKKRFYSRFK